MQAIVITAEATEQQLVEAACAAARIDNWEIGKAASLWCEQWSAGRTDADFVKLCEQNGDGFPLSADQVKKRRLVYSKFGDGRKGFKSLSWTHCYVAIGWPDAEEVLRWASETEATCREMQAYRAAKNGKPLTPAPKTVAQPTTYQPAPEPRPPIVAPKPAAKTERTEQKPEGTGRKAEGSRTGNGVPAKTQATTTETREFGDLISTTARLTNAIQEIRQVSIVARADVVKALRKLIKELDPRAATPGIPTVLALVAEIPDDWTAERKAAATDWIDYKQDRPAKKERIQSAKSFRADCKRMAKYTETVLCDAIETAIAKSWIGWEHEDVKAQQATARVRATRREPVYRDFDE